MNEEETFQRLKRVTLAELRDLRWEHYYQIHPTEIPEEFFKGYGWTRKEYLEEMYKLGYTRYAER